MIVAFHLDEIIERLRIIHAEYALKTLERKSLLYKSYSEEAAKVIKRLRRIWVTVIDPLVLIRRYL